MIELLAPAGDLERAKVAYDYGADAVYVGGKRFSLRAKASNFDIAAITEIAQYAHALERKIYITVNMLPHQEDLEGLEDYLLELNEAKVDAIIVASLSIAALAQQLKVNYEVHLSTQLSITNSKAIQFYKRAGIDRIVLARELDIEDVRSVTANGGIETEIFIHGGMCVNYSGRCTLSNQMTLRDANRGGCAQSCRWYYELKQNETKLSIDENPFTFGSKDLSTLAWIEDFVKAGVSSLKIEGRMKSAYYIGVVVKTYRRLIDAIQSNSLTPSLMTQLQSELSQAEGRLTFDGFYDHLPNANDHLYLSMKTGVLQSFVGAIVNQKDQAICVEIRNAVKVGDVLEVFEPYQENRQFTITSLRSIKDEILEVANVPMAHIWMEIPFTISEKAFIRKVVR